MTVSFEKHSTEARQQQDLPVSFEKHSTDAREQADTNADQERAKANVAGAIESLGSGGTMEALAAGLSREEFAKIRAILEGKQDQNWIGQHEAERSLPLSKDEILAYTDALAQDAKRQMKDLETETSTGADPLAQKHDAWAVDPEKDGLDHERAEIELTDRAVAGIANSIKNGSSLTAIRQRAEHVMLEDDGRIFTDRTGNHYERQNGLIGLGNPVEGRYAKMYWGGAVTIQLLNDIEQNPARVRQVTEELNAAHKALESEH